MEALPFARKSIAPKHQLTLPLFGLASLTWYLGTQVNPIFLALSLFLFSSLLAIEIKYMPIPKKVSKKNARRLGIFVSVVYLSTWIIPAMAAPATGGGQQTFSVLFSATEGMIKSCITDSLLGMSFIVGLIIGGLRLGFLGLAVGHIYSTIEGYRQKQQITEQVTTIVVVIVALIIIGLLEPKIVANCTGATSGTTTPTTPTVAQ
jgi:hypothetical protein